LILQGDNADPSGRLLGA